MLLKRLSTVSNPVRNQLLLNRLVGNQSLVAVQGIPLPKSQPMYASLHTLPYQTFSTERPPPEEASTPEKEA